METKSDVEPDFGLKIFLSGTEPIQNTLLTLKSVGLMIIVS
jgi:hypothetical protein